MKEIKNNSAHKTAICLGIRGN